MALAAGANLKPVNWLWGQLAVTATQFMTHFANEYFDLAADKENPHPVRWTGGSRILVEGAIAPRVALLTAIILGTVALLAGLRLLLVAENDLTGFLLLLLAISLAWSYSAPPLRLNQRGLGEIGGALLITGLTPTYGYYLQAGQLDLLPLIAAIPLSCWQFAVLISLNIPDAEGDAIAGKRTLVHYLGKTDAVRLYLFAITLLYASLPVLVHYGLPGIVASAMLAVLPVTAWQGWRMARGAWADPGKWDSLAFWGFGILVLLSLAELVAFLYLWLYPTA
jgi:1,4-dihydroxy-2-naphthoate octaprenyltransferase